MKTMIKSIKIFFMFNLLFSFTIANATSGDGSIKGKIVDKKQKNLCQGSM